MLSTSLKMEDGAKVPRSGSCVSSGFDDESARFRRRYCARIGFVASSTSIFGRVA